MTVACKINNVQIRFSVNKVSMCWFFLLYTNNTKILHALYASSEVNLMMNNGVHHRDPLMTKGGQDGESNSLTK